MNAARDDSPVDPRLADLLARLDDLLAGQPAEPLPDEALQRLEQARQLLRAIEEARTHDGARTVPTDFTPGTRLAQYQLVELLGQGGMGVVYKAHDTRLDRVVALKFLPSEFAQERDRLDRFVREARLASALNHPHICTVHELGEHDGRPFLVMEYIQGRTLRGLCGQSLGLDALAQLIGQAARALTVAHAAGIVHRDIKPENLMVREDGYLKVLDFGLARRLHDPLGHGSVPGGLIGTFSYMSPEQARGRAVTSASDLFSLGIVLYELATGRHPFGSGTALEMLLAITGRTPAPLTRLNPDLGGAVETLVLRMLDRDPNARPNAAEVEATLSALSGRRGAWPVRAPEGPTTLTQKAVGREQERALLQGHWLRAVAGQGSMVCVSGEPGIGKTTLVEEFLGDVADPPCYLARGRCSERVGSAEVYQPFLQGLEALLCGDQSLTLGRLTKQLAPSWYALVVSAALDPDVSALRAEMLRTSQSGMKRELRRLLEALCRQRPVVLFFDDVHWADNPTVELLAQIGAECSSQRLLVVLTYRPTELLLNDHPFRGVRLNLEAAGRCHEIALGFLSRADLDIYLRQTLGNHDLPRSFADAIHSTTEGNPLFLAALVRYLGERGVIARSQGRWRLVRSLPDLQGELPPSVRSMIQRKLDLLTPADRQLLAAASVQGLEFDSTVLARVLNREPADVEERLKALEEVHGLVRLVREQEAPDRTLSLRYAFVHLLYQNALDGALPPSRRAAWSGASARVLAASWGEKAGDIAAELAVLFETGREFLEAAHHFHLAAENASRVFAHQEAAGLARRGLAALRGLPPTPQRNAIELRLAVTLGLQLQMTQGFAAPSVEQTYRRARELCSLAPEGAPLFEVLWGLWLFAKVRSELGTATELAGQLQVLAAGANAPRFLLQACQALAVTALCRGSPQEVCAQMEQALLLYDPASGPSHTFQFGQDPGVACLAFGAVALWLLGQPDQAVLRSDEAVQRARAIGQPSTLALSLHFAAMLRQLRREPALVLPLVEESRQLAADHGFDFWHAGARVLGGWARATLGLHSEGIQGLRDGLTAWKSTGSETYRTYYLALLAEVLAAVGQVEEGLSVLAEGHRLADDTGEGLYRAELFRLQGELLLAHAAAGPVSPEAESCLHQALQTARAQQARSLELRALLTLVRLGQRQGHAEAWEGELAACLARFPADLDTPDLSETRTVLLR